MMKANEYTANAALHAAAQRLEAEQAHFDAWCKPAPQRAPRARTHCCNMPRALAFAYALAFVGAAVVVAWGVL